ncbi:MAG: type II toxin-antitoxin system VapC family toxin [Burkholderiales bacterium]
MKIFFDTSALLQCYLPEPGRETVLRLLAKARPAVVAAHCKIELYSALVRIRRETEATEHAYRSTCAELERTFSNIAVAPISTLVERVAVQTLESADLRGACALHVATAVVAGAELFVTADLRQHRVAVAAGLNASLIDGA